MESDAPSATSNKQVILRRQNVKTHNIASACSTPPTTLVLPSMFNQRVCSDIHTAHYVANEKHGTHTHTRWLLEQWLQSMPLTLDVLACLSLLRSLAPFLSRSVFVYASEPLETESATLHIHPTKSVRLFALLLLLPPMKSIMCALRLWKWGEKTTEAKEIHRKIIGTHETMHIFMMCCSSLHCPIDQFDKWHLYELPFEARPNIRIHFSCDITRKKSPPNFSSIQTIDKRIRTQHNTTQRKRIGIRPSKEPNSNGWLAHDKKKLHYFIWRNNNRKKNTEATTSTMENICNLSVRLVYAIRMSRMEIDQTRVAVSLSVVCLTLARWIMNCEDS